MSYSVDKLNLLKESKDQLRICCTAATMKQMKLLSKQFKLQLISTKVHCIVDDITNGLVTNKDDSRMSLYLASTLTYGATKLFKAKVHDLFEKTSNLLKELMDTPVRLTHKKINQTNPVNNEAEEDEIKNLDIDYILNKDLPNIDIKNLFQGFDETDRNLIDEIDESEVIETFSKHDRSFDRVPSSPNNKKSNEQKAKDIKSVQPVTPKRKSARLHNETPIKRKSLIRGNSTSDALCHRSLIPELMVELAESAESPEPTTEPITEPIAEPIVEPVVEPIAGPVEAAEQHEMNISQPIEHFLPTIESTRNANSVLDNQTKENEQKSLIDPSVHLPATDGEAELVLSEVDSAFLVPKVKKSRRVYRDEKKQIEIKYKSDSSALNKIYTRTMESCLPNVLERRNANVLLSSPLNRILSTKLLHLFRRNLQPNPQPCARDEFVNKSLRQTRLRYTSVSAPFNLDKSITPPLSQQIREQQYHKHRSSSIPPSRGFSQPMDSEFAASPGQIRQSQTPLEPLIADEPVYQAEMPIPISMDINESVSTKMQRSTFTRNEFYDLLEQLWALQLHSKNPPVLFFNYIFIKTLISKTEVTRFLLYLFELERQRMLNIIEDEESSSTEYLIWKLE